MNEEEEVWSLAIAQSSPLIRSFWMGQYLQLVEGRQPHCDIRNGMLVALNKIIHVIDYGYTNAVDYLLINSTPP